MKKIISPGIAGWLLAAVISSSPSAQAAEFGDPLACENPLAFTIGSVVAGELSGTDCFIPNRFVDRFLLELTEQTLFRTTFVSNEFQPVLSILRNDTNATVGQRSTAEGPLVSEIMLRPDTYRLSATSLENVEGNPAAGDYSIDSELLQEPQSGCFGTRTMVSAGVVANGTLGSDDCTTLIDAQYIHHWDGYSVYLNEGQWLNVAAMADVDFILSHYLGTELLEHSGPYQGDEELRTLRFQAPASGYYGIDISVATPGATGNYSLTFHDWAPVSALERAALIALYQATDGSNWENKTNWLGDEGTECTWYGVLCAANGTLYGLSLHDNGLNGTIPSEITDLQQLRVLILSTNDLAGPLPADIGALSYLLVLGLAGNEFEGSIPAALGGLENLEQLNLAGNNLSGPIPDSLGNLGALKILSLQDNALDGSIPLTLWELGTLERLNLQRNQLAGTLPDSIGLPSLISLDLGGNQLSGDLPVSLGTLSNLESLFLWGNLFEGPIPTELGNLLKLRDLSLSGNDLDGVIPSSLNQLTKLVNLWLDGNQLYGTIPELSALVDLERLELQWNQLTGSIPGGIGTLSNLNVLNLEHNLLTGSIPESFLGLINLDQLRLNHNLLTGAVPAGLGALPDLSTYDIWGNVGLDVAIGNVEACAITTELALDGALVDGELTPFTDCPIEELPALVDNFHFDLSAMQAVQFDAHSLNFWPVVGLIDANSRLVTPGQGMGNNLHTEMVLPIGQYTPYIHGGSYNHDYNVGVAASGPYSVGVTSISEPQMGCMAPTIVTFGSVANAVLDSGDCLDEYAQNRPNDRYAIWLNEGQGVTVTFTADFPLSLYRFHEGSYLGEEPAATEGVEHTFSYYAAQAGMHSFGIYTAFDTPEQAGNYSVTFTATESLACENVPELIGGTVIEGTLTVSDCMIGGRLVDRFLLDLDAPMVLKANLDATGYLPLISITPLPAPVGPTPRFYTNTSNSLQIEYALPAGQYRIAATSRIADAENPPTGSYTLTTQVMTGAGTYCMAVSGSAYTELFAGSSVTGSIVESDCIDNSGSSRFDNYSTYLTAGEVVVVTVTTGFGATLVHAGGAALSTTLVPPNQTTSYIIHSSDARYHYLSLHAGMFTGNYALSMESLPAADLQKEVLSELYNATNGPGWENQLHWFEDENECNWFGVFCDDNGLVISLELTDNNLVGQIPESIVYLQHLHGLALGGNSLTGDIPARIGTLTELRYLHLWENQLWGAIPASLGQLDHLMHLTLSDNNLSGDIPVALADIPTLQQLHIGGNQLTGVVPQVLLDKASLTDFVYYGNHFAISLTERNALLALYNATDGEDWTDNEGWGGEAGTECSWYGITCSGGKVERIQLDENNLVGTLPANLAELAGLVDLNLGGNELTGSIPVEFGQLARLHHLGLWSNALSGGIPDELGDMLELRALSLGGNLLTGGIPSSLGNLEKLQYLHLNHNRLTGSIPEELGALTELLMLQLDHNFLEGAIPASLGNLSRLESLLLNNNLLTGDVPPSVTSLVLDELNLWANSGLNIAVGDAAACNLRSSLALNEILVGELTPYEDCHLNPTNEMVDYLTLTLIDEVTTVRLTAQSDHYHPRIGVLDASGKQIVEAYHDNDQYSIELTLPAGVYMPYITGGSYNHDYTVNIPATGSYSVAVDVIDAPQLTCTGPTAVVKGVSIATVLDGFDCISTAEDSARLFDEYIIELAQGEGVSVTLDADFNGQLHRFRNNQYESSTPFSNGTEIVGFNFVADSAGEYRFAVTTHQSTPTTAGQYAIGFADQLDYGNPDACVNIAPVGLGSNLSGEISAETDCYVGGRLRDYFNLNLSQDTIYQGTMSSDDFTPLGLIYSSDGSLLLGAQSLRGEYYLPAGDYQVVAGANGSSFVPTQGAYQFELSEPLTEPQDGCVGITWTVAGMTADAAIAANDCIDSSAADSDTVQRHFDYYGIYSVPGETIYVTVDADFDYHLTWLESGQVSGAISGPAYRSGSIAIGADALTQNILYLVAHAHQGTGNYTLSFSHEAPEAPIDRQRNALVALYNATDGDNWHDATNWFSDAPVCDWFGVSCDQQGRITEIALPDNNLVGDLPIELAQLEYLAALTLPENDIGNVPDAFDDSVVIDVSVTPPVDNPDQIVLIAPDSAVLLEIASHIPVYYDVSSADASLTGLGLRVHYSSEQIGQLSFADILNTDLVQYDQSARVDSNDLDDNPVTDRYLVIAWLDQGGSWPGVVPMHLFDLRVQLLDSVIAGDIIELGISVVSRASGYDLVVPAFDVVAISQNLDVDGDGDIAPLTDGLLLLRYMFDFSGDALIANIIGADAERTSADQIAAQLDALLPMLDIDGDGTHADALTDGLLILRYLFDFRGDALLEDALGAGATRTSVEAVESYLAAIMQGAAE